MLLQTKLYIPQQRPFLVPRSRLIKKLDRGRHGKLTLVSAPAGYGKSTLIVDWLTQPTNSISACWLSLDNDDNDVLQFWRYVITALQTAETQLGAEILPILANTPTAALSALLTALINEVTAVEDNLLLVLDDYHVIDNPLIHETIEFWLSYMPPQMHLVIISRADPPLSLSRLRAQGQMMEVRDVDLRFTEMETAVFLNDLMHLNLVAEDVAALATRTEGWVASLQLTAVAMQSLAVQHADRGQFIANFTGSDRYIVDYLMEEVLQQQPPAIQDFLLQTAILERLSAPLCTAVLGDGAAEKRPETQPTALILEQLDSANLFLIPLDNQRIWYRYHHLFRDLLRYRLRETHPARIVALHRRASQWYAQHNYAEDAIAHALAAEDFEYTAQLIEQHADDLFSQGKIMRLRKWLGLLPDTLIHSRPKLYLVYGWMLLRMGQLRELATLLQNLPTDKENMAAEVAVFRAYITLFQGDFARSIELAQQALALVPADNKPVRLAAINQLARSYDAVGDADKAVKWTAEMVKLGWQRDSLTAIIAGLGQLVQLYAELGQFIQARAAFDQVITFAATRNNSHLPLLGPAYIGMGYVYYRQGDLETAVAHLKKGITRCQQWGGVILFTALKGYRILVQALQAQGDVAAANAMLIEATQLAQQNDVPAWAINWVETLALAPPQAPARVESLTQRELDVLHLLVDGRSGPQIADELIIGISTVRTHIKRIYAKLDAHNRQQAINRARELGLLAE